MQEAWSGLMERLLLEIRTALRERLHSFIFSKKLKLLSIFYESQVIEYI